MARSRPPLPPPSSLAVWHTRSSSVGPAGQDSRPSQRSDQPDRQALLRGPHPAQERCKDLTSIRYFGRETAGADTITAEIRSKESAQTCPDVGPGAGESTAANGARFWTAEGAQSKQFGGAM